MEGIGYPFDLVNEYVLRQYHIDMNRSYMIERIPARQLIVPERIDLMAKWIYIDAYVRNMDKRHAIELYAAHLDAFSQGEFIEPGEEYKDSLEAYLCTFDMLIEDIRDNGFDEERSIVPVGECNIILDGAHRVAISAYFDQMIAVIRFPDRKQDFGTDFFRNNLLNSSYLKQMASQYLTVVSDCYFACLWPIAHDLKKMDHVERIIKEYGKIVFTQDIYLDQNGMRNFMAQIYGHQAWVGTYEDHFAGVDTKVQACYKKDDPIRTIVFSAETLEDVLEIKSRVRDIYGLENHSIHISDDILETRQIAELLYNDNSLHHLNYGVPDAFLSIHRRMAEFKELVRKNQLDIDRFIVDSGSVLEIYGLRRSRDLDYLTDYAKMDPLQTEEIDDHFSEMQYYDCLIEDLLYDPQHYFRYNGVKFVSQETLITLKKNRNERKDKKDIRLLMKSLKKGIRHDLLSEETILRYERKHKMYGRGLIGKKEFIKCLLKEFIQR